MTRHRIGQPETLGQLRNITDGLPDATPLAVRNGPLPTLYLLGVGGTEHLEIEIPCVCASTPNTSREAAVMPAWLCREPDEYKEYILLLGDRPAPVPLTGCRMKWGNSWNNELLLTAVEWEILLSGIQLSPGDGPVKVGIRVELWQNTERQPRYPVG